MLLNTSLLEQCSKKQLIWLVWCSKTCMNLSALMVESSMYKSAPYHHRWLVCAVKHCTGSSLGGSFPFKPISTEPELRGKQRRLWMLFMNSIRFVLTCGWSWCVMHITGNFLSVKVSSKNPGRHHGDSKLYRRRSVFLEKKGKCCSLNDHTWTDGSTWITHTHSRWQWWMHTVAPLPVRG